ITPRCCMASQKPKEFCGAVVPAAARISAYLIISPQGSFELKSIFVRRTRGTGPAAFNINQVSANVPGLTMKRLSAHRYDREQDGNVLCAGYSCRLHRQDQNVHWTP